MIELRLVVGTQLMSIEKLNNIGIKSQRINQRSREVCYEIAIENFLISNSAFIDTNYFFKIYYKS